MYEIFSIEHFAAPGKLKIKGNLARLRRILLWCQRGLDVEVNSIKE
jgi:hypothetical protein